MIRAIAAAAREEVLSTKSRKVPSEIERLTTAFHSWQDGLARLGECIAEFQRAEDVLSICISAMIGSGEKIGKIVTSEMSYRAKVSVYRALFIHHLNGKELPKDISGLVSRLYWAEEERNTLVHSIWDASEDQPEAIERQKASCRKKGLVIDQAHVTPDDLRELARLYEGIATDLIYLTRKNLPKVAIRL